MLLCVVIAKWNRHRSLQQAAGWQWLIPASGCRLVRFNGLPEEEDRGLWPSSEDLQSLLITRPHCPLGTAELEADCITLLSTGAPSPPG